MSAHSICCRLCPPPASTLCQPTAALTPLCLPLLLLASLSAHCQLLQACKSPASALAETPQQQQQQREHQCALPRAGSSHSTAQHISMMISSSTAVALTAGPVPRCCGEEGSHCALASCVSVGGCPCVTSIVAQWLLLQPLLLVDHCYVR